MELIEELAQQPEYLRNAAAYYSEHSDLLDLWARFPSRRLVFTGMGASYHAAWISSYYMSHLGLPAAAVEASELLNYGIDGPGAGDPLVYISQSGSSGEILSLLDRPGTATPLVGITNHVVSELASRAQVCLPMCAGEEDWIASKTYLNTLAILWMAARRASGKWDGSEQAVLEAIAGRVGQLIEVREESTRRMLEALAGSKTLVFLGHGPHMVSARQSAMILAEWSKLPSLHSGIGAFRHGSIEIVEAGSSAIVFAPPGRSAESALSLARDLESYGARVVLVENGNVRFLNEDAPALPLVDEFLSPILDAIPVQLLTEALARQRGFGQGFRHIAKVVTRL